MRGPGSMDWSSSQLDDDLFAALDTRRIAAVVGELGAAIAVFDPALHLLAWNDAATQVFGWQPDALGAQLRYRPDDLLPLADALAGHTTHLSTIGKSRDGHEVIVSSVMAPVFGTGGRVVAVMSASFDRTAEVGTARRARLQQRRQAVLLLLGRLALQDGPDADVARTACSLAARLLPSARLTVGTVDADGVLRAIGGEPPVQLDGPLAVAIAAWAGEGTVNDHVVHAGVGERSGRTSVFLVRADDGESLGLVARTTAPTAWSAGDLQFLSSIASFLGTHLGRRRMAAALRARAQYDDLTGLANRRHLVDALGKALRGDAPEQSHVGLLFFDVDRFKEINDRFGHKGGDVVLLEMAARLRESAGTGDLVARLGGDEFVVLCRNVHSQHHLLEIASRFMDSLASPFLVANRLLRVTASCGAALADGSPDEEEALRWADVAMYDAKRNGRAHVRSFSTGLGEARTRELQIDAALRERASTGEFVVTYQPRFALPDRHLGAIEARVEAGVEGGDSRRFIQLADELGTSTAIIARALVETLTTVFPALPAFSDVCVVVQIPADMLDEVVVASSALDTLASLGIAPTRLTLQAVGAGVYGTDESPIHPALAAAGVRFAVTDLGASTTSMGGFLDPWAQEVLLAEHLVSQLESRKVARHFTETATGFALGIGLAVVGDGVTTEEQLQFLEAAGCTGAQGPLWGQRMTAEELLGWLPAHADP